MGASRKQWSTFWARLEALAPFFYGFSCYSFLSFFFFLLLRSFSFSLLCLPLWFVVDRVKEYGARHMTYRLGCSHFTATAHSIFLVTFSLLGAFTRSKYSVRSTLLNDTGIVETEVLIPH